MVSVVLSILSRPPVFRRCSSNCSMEGSGGRFRSQLCNKILAAGTRANDASISPVIRQTLWHWGLERLFVSTINDGEFGFTTDERTNVLMCHILCDCRRLRILSWNNIDDAESNPVLGRKRCADTARHYSWGERRGESQMVFCNLNQIC